MHYGSAPGETSFVVALEDDAGITGYGEVAMLDGRYSEAFPDGVPAGTGFLAPALLGLDATDPQVIAAAMDDVLRGQAYIKTAIDIAAWDAAGKARGVPLCALTGGAGADAVPLYDVVTAGGTDDAAAELADELLAAGYRRLQVKVGGDPVADATRLRRVHDHVPPGTVLFADANGGFDVERARVFLSATADLGYTLEQPCATLEECAALRDDSPHPLVLDESITTAEDLRRAVREARADGVTIKLGRVGGITPARAIRDEAVALGLTVTIEAIGGASIGTAAFVHLGIGVPAPLRCHTVDFQRWWTVDNGRGLPAAIDGAQAPPTGPGLGIDVDESALGEPVLDVRR